VLFAVAELLVVYGYGKLSADVDLVAVLSCDN